jgi:AcrR family transcriptional regulator
MAFRKSRIPLVSGAMAEASTKRGRPLDPAVGVAALRATLDLLDEHGYAELRVADVARRAGIGLGALYRRWATKQDLVVAALEQAADDIRVPETADPRADLLDSLVMISQGMAGRGGRLLGVLFAGTEPELADAIRQAKVVPLRDANRRRLRRIVGDVPDLTARADAGAGMIVLHALAAGRPMTRRQIRERVLPIMVGTPAGG